MEGKPADSQVDARFSENVKLRWKAFEACLGVMVSVCKEGLWRSPLSRESDSKLS
jgi:hypothetical protein